MTSSNPARALLEIFRRWQKAATPASRTRNLGTSEGIKETVAALRILDAISSRLDLLELQRGDVQVFRDAVDVWLRDILHYGQSWAQTPQAVHQIELLEALAITLDGALPALVVGDPATFHDSVGELINEVAEAIKDDDSLDPYLRNYLTETVIHARTCLNRFEASGTFDVLRALKDLELLMHAARSMSRDKASRWQSVLAKVSAFMSNPTAAAVTAAISGSAVTALIGPA